MSKKVYIICILFKTSVHRTNVRGKIKVIRTVHNVNLNYKTIYCTS